VLLRTQAEKSFATLTAGHRTGPATTIQIVVMSLWRTVRSPLRRLFQQHGVALSCLALSLESLRCCLRLARQ
jgi:hypothetical protein